MFLLFQGNRVLALLTLPTMNYHQRIVRRQVTLTPLKEKKNTLK